jgi:alpha-glucosidase (family GH31 glycosyl hydrolase)
MVRYRCGKSDHYIAKCPYGSDSDTDDDKKKMKKKKYYHKKNGGKAYIGKEWDSNESSIDSSDEDAANIAINKGLIFPNIGHKCLYLQC